MTTAAVEAEEAIAASMRAARAARIASAVEAGEITTLVGKGTTLRVIATFTLAPTAATVVGAAIVVVTVKQTFDIGWAIGSVVEGKISEVQRGLTQYDKEDSDPCDIILDRGQLRNAHILGKEHAVKSEALGTKKNLAKFDICGCRDGRVVVKYHGCKGPILAPTPYTWKRHD